MSRNWRHNADGLEDEKQREAQNILMTNHRMRILLVAHSCGMGGAERAFINLLSHLTALGHQPVVMCPNKEGPSFDLFMRMNLEWIAFPMPWAAPSPSSAFVVLARGSTDEIESYLRERKIDLVISNTLVVLHGPVLAARLGIPHITWVHELIEDDSLLSTVALPSIAYFSLLADLNDHLICCSKTVQTRVLRDAPASNTSVLYPYVEEIDRATPHTAVAEGPVQLLFVGLLQQRKNAKFAVAAIKALRLRGLDVTLHVFGGDHDQATFARQQVVRWGLEEYVTFTGYADDWRQRSQGRAIHLVCSTHEPFGLTVPEALSAGIPVVSSRCGGPEELLPENLLYEPDDLDAAVRTIERVAADYPGYAQMALDLYRNASSRFSAETQQEVVRSALAEAVRDYRPKPLDDPFLGPGFSDALNIAGFPRSKLVANIARVLGEDEQAVEMRIAAETNRPGSSVQADCKGYDVVPFAMSAAMQSLHREGTGFVFEFAAAFETVPRLQMAAFIMTRLLHEQLQRSTRLRILAVGDGLGFDAMRLASCGFDVDYMGYGDSPTVRVAAANLAAFASQHPAGSGCIRVVSSSTVASDYDAFVCLELLQNVQDPGELLAELAARLDDGGLAFLSEYFDGICDESPTHLWENETYAGRLPWLAAPAGLDYQECNLVPYGKPSVFIKRTAGSPRSPDPIFCARPFSFMLQVARHMGYLD